MKETALAGTNPFLWSHLSYLLWFCPSSLGRYWIVIRLRVEVWSGKRVG
jgi:hypothetical protein